MSVPSNASRIYTHHHGLPVNGHPANTTPSAQLDILSSLLEQSANSKHTINNNDEQKVLSTTGKVKTSAAINKQTSTTAVKRTNNCGTVKDFANKKNRQAGRVSSSSSENPVGKSTSVKKGIKDANNKEIIPIDKTPPPKVVEEQGGSETGDGNNKSRDKVFACLICSRCFGYKHVLQNHERIHTGEKPYFCKICDKRFRRGHHLKTHMRLHTGEKPYNCNHCDRGFVQVANLRRHLRVHTGERPYSCDFCPSRFSNSSQLKAHLMIHTGQKPHFCEECCGRFRRRHHRTHHKCTKDNKQLYLLQISRHPPASRGSGSHEKPGGLSGSQVSQLPPPPLLVLTLSSQLFLNKLIPKTYLWDPDMDYEQGISREVTRASVRQSDLIGILSSIQNPPNSTVTRRDVALQTVGTVSMTQTSILPHPKGEKVIRSAAYFSTDYSVQTIM